MISSVCNCAKETESATTLSRYRQKDATMCKYMQLLNANHLIDLITEIFFPCFSLYDTFQSLMILFIDKKKIKNVVQC